ncbi:unnamed protein product [Parajaminaea phylloscopi]
MRLTLSSMGQGSGREGWYSLARPMLVLLAMLPLVSCVALPTVGTPFAPAEGDASLHDVRSGRAYETTEDVPGQIKTIHPLPRTARESHWVSLSTSVGDKSLMRNHRHEARRLDSREVYEDARGREAAYAYLYARRR